MDPFVGEKRVQNGAQKGCIMHPQLEPVKYPPYIPPKTRKSKPKDNGELEASFGRFWAAYPRRVAKVGAFKAWAKLKPDALLVERILKAVNEHKRSVSWLRDAGQYIPYPATWLNERRWEDEIIAPGQTLTPARRREEPWLAPVPPQREVRP